MSAIEEARHQAQAKGRKRAIAAGGRASHRMELENAALTAVLLLLCCEADTPAWR